MATRDNDVYYRNNTVDLDTGEVKDTPRSEGGQSGHEVMTPGSFHPDSPVIVDHRRKPAHSSPIEPTIIESENDVVYHGNGSGENTQRDVGHHVGTSQQVKQPRDGGHVIKRNVKSPPLSPRQRDLVYQSSINKDHHHQQQESTHTYNPGDEGAGRQKVMYLMRSRSPQKSGKSAESTGTIENSKRSTVEDELKSLSTTPRYSHEDLGRIVSPPDSESVYTRTDVQTDVNTLSNVDDDMKSILQDASTVKRDILGQENKRKDLQNSLWDVEEEVKDLNVKLATLRVKLGVANANTNVSKTECEELRKKYQETQIQMARLEERSKSSTAELERLKDPDNPESNVNMKKIVVNDRKEIRRLRNELEGIRSERSEARKQMDEQDERIVSLKAALNDIQEQVNTCKEEYKEANARSLLVEKEREEMETKCNELLKEKEDFESQYTRLNKQLENTISGTSTIHKVSEQYKNKEQTLLAKIASTDKKLRDVLTEIEQQKNRNMPQRTASSIKYHQYRMSKTSGVVTDTTPQVIVTSNPKGSITSSGFLGKTVISQKQSLTGLPARTNGSSVRQTIKGKPSSLTARR